MNLEDIAKIAGVSRSTVSRVLNNEPNVSAAARTRVQATIDKVGFRPNAAARALASHRSHAIGLVVPEDFSRYHVDNWYPLIIEGTLSAARDAGQSLMLIMEDSFAPDSGARLTAQFFDSNRVDGFLVLLHSYRDHLTTHLMEKDIPFVLIAESDIPGTSWVDNDNFAGGAMLANLLKEQGVEAPLMVAATDEHVPTRRRMDGFRSVFPNSGVVFTGHSFADAESLVRPVLASCPPDAVFAVNNWVAPVVHGLAINTGIDIPNDLLLVTFDEFDVAKNTHLDLTSVIQHVSVLADRAVNLLIDRVEGRAPPGERIVLDCGLQTRGSSRKPTNPVLQGGTSHS